jgi:ribosome-binding protein aMBF1 (putative translation factor)
MGECEMCSEEATGVLRYVVLNRPSAEEELCGRCAGVLSAIASVRSIERKKRFLTDGDE